MIERKGYVFTFRFRRQLRIFGSPRSDRFTTRAYDDLELNGLKPYEFRDEARKAMERLQRHEPKAKDIALKNINLKIAEIDNEHFHLRMSDSLVLIRDEIDEKNDEINLKRLYGPLTSFFHLPGKNYQELYKNGLKTFEAMFRAERELEELRIDGGVVRLAELQLR